MPATELSPEHLHKYDRDGYCVVRSFLSPEEVAGWRAAVDAAVAVREEPEGSGGRLHHSVPSKFATTEEERASLTTAGVHSGATGILMQSSNLWMTDAKVRELMLCPKIGKMIADLTHADGVRIWHDQAIHKEPYAKPTSFHCDNGRWSFSSAGSCSLWVALDDVSEANGCMYFLPGTHRSATLGVESSSAGASGIGDIFQQYPEWLSIEPVANVLRAGDCSIHSGMLAHSAAANMTPRWRRVMNCAYMPDGCTFNGNQNILPRAYVDTLEIGDVIDEDVLVPLIYHRDPSRTLASRETFTADVAPRTLSGLREVEKQRRRISSGTVDGAGARL